jgi:hypothetical protein
VVEGPEQQHGIGAGVGAAERPGIADLGGQPAAAQIGDRLLDVPGRQVDQVHLVAVVQQPRGVHPGGAADIEHPGGRRWQVPSEDVPRAHQLQLAEPAAEAILLPLRLVVPDDVGQVVVHRRTTLGPPLTGGGVSRRCLPSGAR